MFSDLFEEKDTENPNPNPFKRKGLLLFSAFLIISISTIYFLTKHEITNTHGSSDVVISTELTTLPSTVYTPTPGEESPPQPISISTPILTPTPVTFVFPTPGPPPKSAWRPPLYPVPWAPTAYDHFYFIRPIQADEVNWPSGNYRYGGIFFEDVIHTGVDIAANSGTPIVAAGSGKVVWAGYGLYSGVASEDDPYGLAVVIRHEFGYNNETLYTLYGHMSRVDVVRGQIVEAGDLLGHVGDTGFTTGPHLHFEVRLSENDFFTTYNPELWVAPPQGWGILAGRVMGTGGQLLHNQIVFIRNLDTEQRWSVQTYGGIGGINRDPYYDENLVIGDLPTGNYELTIAYLGRSFKTNLWLEPGRVNFFFFRGRDGFSLGPPPTPEANFTPPPP